MRTDQISPNLRTLINLMMSVLILASSLSFSHIVSSLSLSNKMYGGSGFGSDAVREAAVKFRKMSISGEQLEKSGSIQNFLMWIISGRIT